MFQKKGDVSFGVGGWFGLRFAGVERSEWVDRGY